MEANFEDMCEITNLTEEAVFENLQGRFKDDQIFTYIGPTLLIVNPYRIIPKLFDEDTLQRITEETLRGNYKGPPHIYAVASKAFRGMKNRDDKQSIIISGESGAGKTESTKYCMQILTKLSKRQTHAIEHKILACNPVLEAFGNSKTVRNENSSRFGKYVQILFGRDHTIKGAKIQSYLLEKSRVSMVEQGERNFHVFYALAAVGKCGTRAAENYLYLNRGQCLAANNINDRDFFKQIEESFTQLGIDQQPIWRLLRAILQLGNLDFDDAAYQRDENNNTCQILNGEALPFLLETLQITASQLETMILKTKRGPFFNNAKKTECQLNRDTLSRAIYNTIFQAIVDRIEVALSPSNQQDSYELLTSIEQPLTNYSEINLLDIFGFENFHKNSLQQLCINFANEKLLSQYNQKVFQSQIQILREDGLENQLQGLKQPSNKETITNISDIFRIVNEKTKVKIFTEDSMIESIKAKFKGAPDVTFEMTNKKIFAIKHSPCPVSYNIEGFKIKNQDELTPQISGLCSRLFPGGPVQNKQVGSKTILSKFNEDIDSLIKKLSESTNHFVRCIKPNESRSPMTVDSVYMKKQIQYLGVFETIKIRQAIFPSRKIYEDFSRDYQQIYPQAKGKTHRQAARIVLNKVQASEKSYLFGNNRVYMSKDVDQKLQGILERFVKLRVQKATYIQRRYRAGHSRMLFRTTVEEIIKRNRIWKFGNRQEERLLQIRKDALFSAFRKIDFQSQRKKEQEVVEVVEVVEVEIQMQEIQEIVIDEDSERQQLKNHEDLHPSHKRSQPYQFPVHESFLNSMENELFEKIQSIEAKLAQKQQYYEAQRSRFDRQVLELERKFKGHISDQLELLKQKDNENGILKESLERMKETYGKFYEQQKAERSKKQEQLSELQQIYQGVLQEKTVLEHEIASKDRAIKELNSDKNDRLEQIMEQIQTQNNKLEKKLRISQTQIEEDRNIITELEKKNKFLENIVREYENIIKKHKIQKEDFFKEKEELHHKLLDKCTTIQELKAHHPHPKPQSSKKDHQIIKHLKEKIIQLENELTESYLTVNRHSTNLLEAQLHLYEKGPNQDFPANLMKDFKISELTQSLQEANAKILVLEEKQSKLTSKLSEYIHKSLKETADFNNKISMANQKFNRDKFTIDQLKSRIRLLEEEVKINRIKIKQLQQEKKSRWKDSQDEDPLEISEDELINFIRYYNKNLTSPERQNLKLSIISIMDVL